MTVPEVTIILSVALLISVGDMLALYRSCLSSLLWWKTYPQPATLSLSLDFALMWVICRAQGQRLGLGGSGLSPITLVKVLLTLAWGGGREPLLKAGAEGETLCLCSVCHW